MKTLKETILHNFLFAPIILFALIFCQGLSQASPTSPRPDPDDAPVFARWLVNQGSWGVLNTLGLDGVPFGNVMSFSDAGTGTPYFYLTTTLDPTGFYALKNPLSSFTLSEYVLGSCDETTDPQSPVCAKITLSGRLRMLRQNSKEAAFAQAALFADHPQLAGWPKQRGFRVFKLVIGHIFLVNMYAPPRNLTVFEYLRANF